MPSVTLRHHSDLKSEMKPLLRLAAPIAFSQMANTFMQIVDTFFVGKLGPESLGGVSLGSGLFAILMVIAIGVLLGLDYRISHAYGARKYEDCQKFLVQGFYLAVGLALPLIAILLVLSGHFANFGIGPGVSAQAGAYLRTLSFSMLPFLLFAACRQYLQATGTAGPILAIYIIANLTNAFGNWLFIFGHWGFPQMGVAGSGMATTISRTLMFLFILGYTLWRNHRLDFSLRRAGLRFHRAMVKDLLVLGLPASGQLVLEVGAFVVSSFLIGRLGSVPLAAHQIVLQIASFAFMMPMGISAAAAVVVGQAIGAKQPARAVRQGWLAIGLGGSVMACFAILLFSFNHLILGAFSQTPEVIEIARTLLVFAISFQIFDGIQVVATGALRGAANTRASMLANLFGHWGVGLPIGALLCFKFHWGAPGIWCGLVIGLGTVSATLLKVWSGQTKRILEGTVHSASLTEGSTAVSI
jgi:multidrug resistance protein, MATE family